MNSNFFLVLLIIFNIHRLIKSQNLTDEDCKCRLPINKRIIGGKIVDHIIPFQVSLALFVHQCGGVIVNRNWIMTAAHCVLGNEHFLEHFTVRVGIKDLQDKDIEHKTYSIKQIVYYDPNFKNFSEIGDFAMLELSEPLIFNKDVRPACIPEKFEHYDDKICSLTAIGWGSTKPVTSDGTDNEPSRFLKEAKYNYVKNCSDNFVCIKPLKDGENPCRGDSGGALIHTKNHITRVVGLTSYSNYIYKNNAYWLCESNLTYYSRVSFYLPKIKSIVGNDYCKG